MIGDEGWSWGIKRKCNSHVLELESSCSPLLSALQPKWQQHPSSIHQGCSSNPPGTTRCLDVLNHTVISAVHSPQGNSITSWERERGRKFLLISCGTAGRKVTRHTTWWNATWNSTSHLRGRNFTSAATQTENACYKFLLCRKDAIKRLCLFFCNSCE